VNQATPAAPLPRYTVAVRALCEFTAKAGDLDLRFTPSPTALEGIAGHAVVASRRATPYESEISLSGEYGQLLVRGRADGYDPASNRLEEVKTYRGELDAMPDNHRHLHWAQVRVYGWLLCQARGLAEVELALVYFDIGSQRETVLTEKREAGWLQACFEDQCRRFQAWAAQELAHRAARDAALLALPFPHAEFRPGQRHLATSVYRTARDGGCLMAQAPTGIGKTVGTLFPLLKACPGQALDKVFFLAAKTSGRALALDALAQIGQAGQPPLRVLELVARDKACEHPDKACHGASCPLAQGFYDRLPAARSAAVQASMLDRQGLRTVALAHQVCPYYLSMELARWADVIIGDYNYYFDLSAMLYGLTLSNQWRVAVLVDEAHNMVERARKMYSAELDQHDLKALRRTAPAPLKKPLDKLNRAWNALWRDQAEPYQVHEDLPDALVHALQQAGTSMTDYLAEHPTEVHEQLQRFYFDVLHFGRIAELFGAHSLFDVTLDAGGRSARLCLRNVVPAPFLKPRLATARATAMFSATLNPRPFYTDMLGLDDKTVWVDVESPFDAGQLAVQVVSHISTRYRQREQSAAPIADLVARQYAQQPGNYLAFFSSFDYLRQVATLLAERHPEVPFWEQSRGMEEGARNAFLARFTTESRGIGFAVLGGAFGEGIDLPGKRLIGAFIATLGLPQINPVNEQLRERMQQVFGAGYDYTYLYPGLQKVVQAAGRVIRTVDDRGVVYLIDDRYVRGEVRRLLPAWWDVKTLRAPGGAQAPGR
jgi:DNA excision repair protein ERCC-2